MIYKNNQETITLAKNSQFHIYTKHIVIQYYFVYEKVIDRQIDLQYISTRNQIIDRITKALFRNKFEAFRTAIEIE